MDDTLSSFAMTGIRHIDFGRSSIDGRKDGIGSAARFRAGGSARAPRPFPPAFVGDHGQP
jgi:hypothetical protein